MAPPSRRSTFWSPSVSTQSYEAEPCMNEFRFACPKCASLVGETSSTNNTFGELNPVFSLAYSCSKCGTRVYGQVLVDEYTLQRARWARLEDDPEIPEFWDSNKVSLSFPSAKDIVLTILRRGAQSDPSFLERLQEAAARNSPLDLEVATEVRTEVATQVYVPPQKWKCGDDGRWCHNTCRRHGECMYPSREDIRERLAKKAQVVRPPCALQGCVLPTYGKSKYCSPRHANLNSSRAYIQRKKNQLSKP